MRAIWSGSLSFGLINIPVKVYSASKQRALKFKMLDRKDLCPIGYSYICKLDQRKVPYDEIVKGYEYEKGSYVVLDEEDFKKADAKKTNTIEIIHFALEEEIDSIYFDKPYYIEPEANASKPYSLLRDALKQAQAVGVARFVFRDRENLGIIKAEDDLLMLDQIRYEDEIRNKEEIHAPEADYSKQEMEIAVSLIDQLKKPFDIGEYKDTYSRELERIIKEKSKGVEPRAKGSAPAYTNAADLFETLKKSLQKEKQKKKNA